MNGLMNTVFNIEVPVKYDVDIMVAGGGPSGVAAAVSASRQGMSVYMAEGLNCFGGMGTAGLVPMFCPFTDGENFLAGGIGREIVEKCLTSGATGPDEMRELDERLYSYITIKAEGLKQIYDDLITDAGIHFSFQTRVIGVKKDNDAHVSIVFCSAKSGIFAVKAQVFIDCTGDGDLASLAGASFYKGDEEGNIMPGTLCSQWAGIDWSNEPVKRWNDGEYLQKAYKDGVLSVEDMGLPGMLRTGDTTGGGNIGHAFGVDPTDEVSVSKATIEQRKRIREYEMYYKKYLRGFEKMELVATAQILGIRESRRIVGEYVLSLDDYCGRAVFSDEIGRFSYQMDIHSSQTGSESEKKYEKLFSQLKYKKGESYGIPYRCLLPAGLDNVLVAGRAISCDRYILGSIRVMPGCFITGQAAGIAASIAVKNNTLTRGISVTELQQRLKKLGAFLPHCQVEQQ